ncbi:unnamed protein product, partial [Mesorhabditis spiculigera]
MVNLAIPEIRVLTRLVSIHKLVTQVQLALPVHLGYLVLMDHREKILDMDLMGLPVSPVALDFLATEDNPVSPASPVSLANVEFAPSTVQLTAVFSLKMAPDVANKLYTHYTYEGYRNSMNKL